MSDLERSGSPTVITFSGHGVVAARTKESLASLQQPTVEHQCRHCHSPVITGPEHEDDDWFLRCLVCGVKNLFVVTLQIVGWRR